jgi:hypothetical protein
VAIVHAVIELWPTHLILLHLLHQTPQQHVVDGHWIKRQRIRDGGMVRMVIGVRHSGS